MSCNAALLPRGESPDTGPTKAADPRGDAMTLIDATHDERRAARAAGLFGD